MSREREGGGGRGRREYGKRRIKWETTRGNVMEGEEEEMGEKDLNYISKDVWIYVQHVTM